MFSTHRVPVDTYRRQERRRHDRCWGGVKAAGRETASGQNTEGAGGEAEAGGGEVCVCVCVYLHIYILYILTSNYPNYKNDLDQVNLFLGIVCDHICVNVTFIKCLQTEGWGGAEETAGGQGAAAKGGTAGRGRASQEGGREEEQGGWGEKTEGAEVEGHGGATGQRGQDFVSILPQISLWMLHTGDFYFNFLTLWLFQREKAILKAQREAERKRQERELLHIQEEQERQQRKKVRHSAKKPD